MNFFNIYQLLAENYPKLDPHDQTWRLWLKQPKNEEELFEVAIGTILVQNTNWKNVDQSISNLKGEGIKTFRLLNDLEYDFLKDLIRPSGFNKQKANYLLSLSNFIIKKSSHQKEISRKELLTTKGIGKETADSILNYCLARPVAIVGTYTRRFFVRITGDISYLSKKYEIIQSEIEEGLQDSYSLGYFHALIVCHCQNLCQKKKISCEKCFLKKNCFYGSNYLNSNNTLAHEIQNKINPKKKKKKD